jgi:predicted outer membrane lipoprotein
MFSEWSFLEWILGFFSAAAFGLVATLTMPELRRQISQRKGHRHSKPDLLWTVAIVVAVGIAIGIMIVILTADLAGFIACARFLA